MTNGPLNQASLRSKQDGSVLDNSDNRAKSIKAISSPSSITPSDSRLVADDSDITARLMEAMEKQADFFQERARSGVNQKIQNIRAILDESGEFLANNEKQAMRKKLFELRMQCIKDGEGGSGV